VQLIDASGFWRKMRKGLGSKRREMGEDDIALVTRLFGAFTEAERISVLGSEGRELEQRIVTGTDDVPVAPEGGRLKRVPISRIFRNQDFGYT
ncbi:hypothetical protein J8J32_20880, partial [Mycobacterium tuberculosis]|nr:hypothetical protein [Mycobacterium tuberculosis]